MKKELQIIEQKAEAIKGFLEICNYMAICPKLTPEVVDSIHILKDWLFNEK